VPALKKLANALTVREVFTFFEWSAVAKAKMLTACVFEDSVVGGK
jgi:hypothetical protein